MLTVTFIDPTGRRRDVRIEEGMTLMEAARRGGIDEIKAECGGGCSCATCHVHVDDAWFAVTGPPGDNESEMLDFSSERGPTSRLSCQIRLRAEHDGLTVHIPADLF